MDNLTEREAEQFVTGVQSLVLKWKNCQYAICEGHNYVRIRGEFFKSEDEKFVTVLVQSDDEAIGVLLAIPSNIPSMVLENDLSLEGMNCWEEVKAAADNLKEAIPTKYKEIWIPGFNIEYSVENLNLIEGRVGDKHVVKVTLAKAKA
eukprot:TRINITY_DN14745_c0_g1_i2.p1 TRINITY_DN14745_c0_g1~~TRINITY_DN14745_c0_g1_i2.p1  ORF type:complete len:148 (-),score=38.61 TRINITY_DN14745_c0_g1_i2:393-836(-)